jgi:hypothetical protein
MTQPALAAGNMPAGKLENITGQVFRDLCGAINLERRFPRSFCLAKPV